MYFWAPDSTSALRRKAAIAIGRSRGILISRLSPAATFGKGFVAYGKTFFRVEGTATIGDYFNADAQWAMISITVFEGATLTIGDNCAFNGGVCIVARHDVRIGSNVLIAPYASMIDDDCHEVEPGSIMDKGPTCICDNVWIGRSTAITPGVTIGKNSVIGANSVVSRDIPPNVFAAGAPAQVIKKLDIPDGWVRGNPHPVQ